MINRKVFIDCGANNGCSIRKFFKVIPDAKEWTIFSFECNPALFKFYPVAQETLVKKAIWIYDGSITFYQSSPGASTLLYEKTQNKVKYPKHQWNPIEVECIDLNKWMFNNIDESDYVILKMDIEGAEYEVLNHMSENHSLDLVNQFWGEIHGWKVGKSQEETDILMEQLSKANLIFNEWDGCGN